MQKLFVILNQPPALTTAEWTDEYSLSFLMCLMNNSDLERREKYIEMHYKHKYSLLNEAFQTNQLVLLVSMRHIWLHFSENANFQNITMNALI